MRKRCVFAIVTALLLSVVVMLVSLISMPDVSISETTIKEANSVLSEVTMKAVNAELSDKLVFEVKGEDPQLYIDGIDEETGALIVDLAEPLPPNTKYQLYYSMDDSGLSEGYSISNYADENADPLVIRLPRYGVYDAFRLDIDSTCQIKDISTINDRNYTNGNYLTAVLQNRASFPFSHWLLCFAILLIESLLIALKWEAIKGWFRKVIDRIKANRTKVVNSIIICLICVIGSLMVWFFMYKMGWTHSKSKYTLFIFFNIGLAVGLLIAIRRQLVLYPERGFLVIVLCIGLLFAILEPSVTGLSWDDETHYRRSVYLNYSGTPFISEAEKQVAMLALPTEVTLDNKINAANYLNQLSFRDGGELSAINTVMFITIVSYVPSAGAIWLSRILGFSVSATVMLGRVCNLLCYAIVAFFAIKQLKYGKLFAASLCLLPTVLFLAGNYSYDTFCIAFILLGVCIWLGVYQRPESKMTVEKAIVMLLAFALGIISKPVYFPLVLFALFLPESRFSSKAVAKRYRWAVILDAVLLMFSIVAPFLMGSGNALFTDVRGGADVDAAGQISYILSNPMRYAQILLRYLFTVYFSYSFIMAPVGGCVRALSYLSMQDIVFSEKIACLFLGVTFIAWLLSFDINDDLRERIPVWVKVICCILSFGTICIAATSLYCAFTPVGSDTIAGFQERYMLPVVIPMLVIIRPSISGKRKMTVGWANAIVLYAEAALLLIGILPFIQRFL